MRIRLSKIQKGIFNKQEIQMVEPKTTYEYALAHYDQVNKELCEYFKIYMQSWSIAGSVIVTGGLFALAKSDGTGTIPDLVLPVLPAVIGIWLVLTSYFWAYFAMYRKYLTELEESMVGLDGAPTGFMIHFHSFRHPWFSHLVQWPVYFTLGLLIGLLYFLIVSWRQAQWEIRDVAVCAVLVVATIGAACRLQLEVVKCQRPKWCLPSRKGPGCPGRPDPATSPHLNSRSWWG